LMGQVNIIINKKTASTFIVICTTLFATYATRFLIVLMVKLEFINFHLRSQQLDALQGLVGKMYLFGFMVFFVSMYMVSDPLKSKAHSRRSQDRQKSIIFLSVAIITFSVFIISMFFFPPKNVYYDLSKNIWYAQSKGSSIIEVFEDSLGRIYVWNNILQSSMLFVALHSFTISHFLKIKWLS
jgi:amino acid transporter